ncbi:MAG: TAT-variant-translocated molybdopterin oxidoreductase, partial [Ignavibacteria bacterium]|nr:TAT-variant-translocated molybdopterin oxidoreductase [Ignavibacteria bacterium]
MSQKSTLDSSSIRTRLASHRGREYWRSLDELADTPEFREFLHREFPREASVWEGSLSRRNFLQIMGASLALGGLNACMKQPDQKIIPYVKQPEIIVPGEPLQFATAALLGGFATGVLATSHMGRPTRIDGNPDHPASLGASDVFTTASILSLYDPDRSQIVLNRGSISTWEKFAPALALQLDIQRALQGSGLRILTETVTSPTLGGQISSLLSVFPKARWHQYEPVNLDSARAGAMVAFGEYVHARYNFDKADIVLSLDADFLATGPGHIRYAHDFAERRRVHQEKNDMNRLYVVEASPTVTGGVADERLA